MSLQDKIKAVMDDRQFKEINEYLDKIETLTNWNSKLLYLFYLLQYGGIFITMYATNYSYRPLGWIGISITTLASLVNVYEKINDSLIKKYDAEIKSIQDGTWRPGITGFHDDIELKNEK